ncbi:MAG: hypothetical protein JXA57_16725 [Armatimonadetes bacterium]|nr:hypothetical protein [Armatimonadota bacterium]
MRSNRCPSSRALTRWIVVLTLLLVPVLASSAMAAESTTFDLQAAINACPAGGTVQVPAGTHTVPYSVSLKSGVSLQGAGIDETVLYMPAQPVQNQLLYGKNVSDVAIRDLTVTSSAATGLVMGIHLTRYEHVVVERVKVTNCDYALKADTQGADLTVRDFTARACGQLYVSNLHTGIFEDLDLEMVTEKYAAVPYHAIYLCANNHHLRFDNTRARGGDSWTVQLWTDYTDEQHASDDIVFNGLDVADNAVVIGHNFRDVTLNDLTVAAVSTRPCIMLGSPTNVTVDGFSASGGPAFLATFDGDTADTVALRNGTYSGSKLIASYADVTNLVVDNVSLGVTATTTTQAPTTTTTAAPTTTTLAPTTTTTAAPTTTTTVAPTTTTLQDSGTTSRTLNPRKLDNKPNHKRLVTSPSTAAQASEPAEDSGPATTVQETVPATDGAVDTPPTTAWVAVTTTTTAVPTTTATAAPTATTTLAPTTTTAPPAAQPVPQPMAMPAAALSAVALEPDATGQSSQVTITTPAQLGQIFRGIVVVQVPVITSAQVDKVICYVDGRRVSMDYAAPFTFIWNAKWAGAAGDHALTVIAFDLRGHEIGRAYQVITCR